MNKKAYPSTWQSREFYSMGSTIALWLDNQDAQLAQRAFDEAEALFATNEQALSRFRDDSELCALNRQSGQWVTVSPLLWDMTVTAVSLAEQTGGLFDPTILNALESVGYTQSFAPGMQGTPSWLGDPAVGWQGVRLDVDRQAICLPAGVRLDLGGVAKGSTAQQAVTLLDHYGPCLVDAGGDLVAGAPPYGWPGWPVAIPTPRMGVPQPEMDMFSLLLADSSLATSGIDYRRWQQDGLWQHHLIDPRNGRSAATDILSVTVLAEDAAVAEAWATAVIVAGSQEGLYLIEQAGLSGLLFNQFDQVLITMDLFNSLDNTEVFNELVIS